MKPLSLQASRVVPGTPDEVFAIIDSPSNFERLNPNCVRHVITTRHAHGGHDCVQDLVVDGQSFTVAYTCEIYEPGRREIGVIEGPFARIRMSQLYEPTRGGTRLGLASEVHLRERRTWDQRRRMRPALAAELEASLALRAAVIDWVQRGRPLGF